MSRRDEDRSLIEVWKFRNVVTVDVGEGGVAGVVALVALVAWAFPTLRNRNRHRVGYTFQQRLLGFRPFQELQGLHPFQPVVG